MMHRTLFVISKFALVIISKNFLTNAKLNQVLFNRLPLFAALSNTFLSPCWTLVPWSPSLCCIQVKFQYFLMQTGSNLCIWSISQNCRAVSNKLTKHNQLQLRHKIAIHWMRLFCGKCYSYINILCYQIP